MRALWWFGLLASLLALLALLAGCSDHSDTPTTPGVPPPDATPGSIRISVQWPQRGGTRLIPPDTESIKIVAVDVAGATVGTAVLERDITTVNLTVHPGDIQVKATAYDGEGGTGKLLAQGRTVVTVVSGKTATAIITLGMGIQIAFAIDDSGSMIGPNFVNAKAAVTDLVNALEASPYGGSIQYGCVTFEAEIHKTYDFTDVTAFRTWFAALIEENGGYEAQSDIYYHTAETLTWNGTERYIVLISDEEGDPTLHGYTIQNVVDKLNSMDIVAHSVVGDHYIQGTIPDARQIATGTGGMSLPFIFGTPIDLKPFFPQYLTP